ncbi:MAG TPA: UDP-N-acetylmuramoyl-L-alanyl-D-glutamate--2,6-diaminopimelate ligase [Thermoguttaceae bacterium]|nr:UDP-N-acetylmuramoyl-L-alanyl-D-glutamate--2,6-diaminopimelate ligase [Thermoguttaceae bacterium]
MVVQALPGLGIRLSLRKLLPEAEFLGGDSIADAIGISRCVGDSRLVQPGDLFVAMAGSRFDGHDHATQAVARGCVAVLAERPLPGLAVPVCIVSDTRTAYGQLCHALAGSPSEQLKVIGITGTNGKTTTSCLLASVLMKAEHKVGLIGTLGYFDGDDVEDATLTTPPADKLALLMERMVRHGCSHAVMEVSSHALAQARVAGIHFDAGCVTNVCRDHLDYHASIQDYRAVKSKLFDYLPAEGFAVINADDPTSSGYLRRLDGPVLTVGIRSAAEINAMMLEQCVSEQTFLLTAGSESVPVRTKMIGTHHVYNCLTAAAAGLACGIDLPTIVRGLEAVEYVPGRLERIECGQPFSVFVDYAHTPDALTACLQTLREVVSGRLICVFGCGGDRDRPKRPLMGRAVEQGADVAVVTTDNPRTEDPMDIIADVLEGFDDLARAEVVGDRAEAIRLALATAKPGDCVLIAGKGHEDYQVIGEEQIPMSDGEVARDWLYEVQPFATS